MVGNNLVEGNGVLVRSIAFDGCPGEVLIRVGMAMNLAGGRVRQTRVDGNVPTKRFENIKDLEEIPEEQRKQIQDQI